MGRASRLKRERREQRPVCLTDRPRWAGANGFEYAWLLNEGYLRAGELLKAAISVEDKATAVLAVAKFQLDLCERRLATVGAATVRAGGSVGGRAEHQREPYFPGLDEDFVDRSVSEHRVYAEALYGLADGHRDVLKSAVPILFDPLSTPEADLSDIEGLRLPFPVVTCDFLAQSGMSMPVAIASDADDWVGLMAATMRQEGEILDVWPVVTTLHPREADEHQNQRSLLYGRARFGGELPDPPAGFVKLNVEGASVWAIEGGEEALWASLWIVAPAIAAGSALRLLDAVNVSLEEAPLPRPERRRAARVGAKPSLEVVIRSSGKERQASIMPSTIDWQHRWTVRGHWMHFKRGPIFNANPRRRVIDPVHGECVRVWCPPFVKGPDDKPLVLKSRRFQSERAA
jgi:hypothetical protein